MPKFPNRWQCNLNSYSSPWMGLLDHVGHGLKTTLDTARYMSTMGWEISYVTAHRRRCLMSWLFTAAARGLKTT